MDWPALMRLGLGRLGLLGLLPDQFWDLTPYELLVMLGVGPHPHAMTRSALETLEAEFDQKMKGNQNDIAR